MTTLRPGGDLPEHLGHVFAEVTLWYSWGSQKQSWRSGLMALEAKTPKDNAGLLTVAQALGGKTLKQLHHDPPVSMRRHVI